MENVEHEDILEGTEKEEHLNGQAQSLMRRIEKLLSFRTAIVFDNGFPFNRRFQRIEVWKLEKEDFTDQAWGVRHFVDLAIWADRIELKAIDQASRVFDELTIQNGP